MSDEVKKKVEALIDKAGADMRAELNIRSRIASDALSETLAELARIRRLESDVLAAAEAWVDAVDNTAPGSVLDSREALLAVATRALREAER